MLRFVEDNETTTWLYNVTKSLATISKWLEKWDLGNLAILLLSDIEEIDLWQVEINPVSRFEWGMSEWGS